MFTNFTILSGDSKYYMPSSMLAFFNKSKFVLSENFSGKTWVFMAWRTKDLLKQLDMLSYP